MKREAVQNERISSTSRELQGNSGSSNVGVIDSVKQPNDNTTTSTTGRDSNHTEPGSTSSSSSNCRVSCISENKLTLPRYCSTQISLSNNILSLDSAASASGVGFCGTISPITFIHIYSLLWNVITWSRANTFLNQLEPIEQRSLLENSLHQLLFVDLFQQNTIVTPYVRYIYERYFLDSEDIPLFTNLISAIERLYLTAEELNHIKTVLLFKSNGNKQFKSILSFII